MQKNLVIVESPAKAKTIEKILGDEYTVRSSYGHIRDLRKKGISIDIEHGFEPEYEVSSDKTKIVSELRQLSAKAPMVWLASDEDREGEAIAWHLAQTLSLTPEKTRRIVFHEITPEAIHHAVQNPRGVDLNLVNAQQARRVLDRLVGFELSPLLWRKVRPNLSAGRVQSVTVKLIVERERTIQNFTSTAYWRVVAELTTSDGGKFRAELATRLETEVQARELLEALREATFKVESIETKPLKRSPAPPFTTSTLQQEAARKLGYSVSQIMSLAQRLYEAGHITYMRTDSVNLSGLAIGTAKEAIYENFGERYHKVRQYSTKSKGAQEAHEAIRPTYISKEVAGETTQERRLYDLIRKRTLASQMADAELEKTTARISVSGRSESFTATGEVIVFDGFLKLYIESSDDESNDTAAEGLLPAMHAGEILALRSATATERFTQRPARYSEASLVKHLEELGIGRPSTYAPTISTVIKREYVVKEDRPGTPRTYTILELDSKKNIKSSTKSEVVGAEKAKLFPTDIGMMVTDYLAQNFASILDNNFTAQVEKEFDEIADGAIDWRAMLSTFYTPFHQNVSQADEQTDFVRSERILGVDPVTGKNVSTRVGKFGPMVQLGDSVEKDAPEDQKPRYASLLKGQLVSSITLEEALSLFELPRDLGEYEDKKVVAAIGRFGPYVRHDGVFTSMKKGIDDPYTVTLDRAIELIEEKRTLERNRLIQDFPAEGIQVLNGRFGPYITKDGMNYKIPKTEDAATLTLERCVELCQGEGTGRKPFKKATTAKSSAAKTTTAKKTATKSTTKTTTAVKKTATKKVATKKI